MERAFEAYCYHMENVMAFRYLGLVMKVVYNDWLAVVGNLQRARKSSGRLLRILIRERADMKVLGFFSRR